MGVESMLLVWGRLWLLGEIVSMLCDIDLYCPHKPHLHTPVKSFLLIMKHQQCTFLLTRQHESSSGCNFNGHPANQFGQCYSEDHLFLAGLIGKICLFDAVCGSIGCGVLY